MDSDSPVHSFLLSWLMIVFSEIGDKTFLIAALMAMKHTRLLVFSAAFSSLMLMSVLSAILGHVVPALISKQYTSLLAAGLFIVFGVRMATEGLSMEKGSASVEEEIKEVEMELGSSEINGNDSHVAAMEAGLTRPRSKLQRATSSPTMSDDENEDVKTPMSRTRKAAFDGMQNLASLLFSPAWVQTFVMTFLGEWGDRSQIATIAMAAGQDYWWVILGTITGHGMCTAAAVVGGRLLASKISVRNVTLGGAGAFLLFGIIYLVEAFL